VNICLYIYIYTCKYIYIYTYVGKADYSPVSCSLLQHVAVCCSVFQGVAECSVFQGVAVVCFRVLQNCCSMSRCVAVCFRVLQNGDADLSPLSCRIVTKKALIPELNCGKRPARRRACFTTLQHTATCRNTLQHTATRPARRRSCCATLWQFVEPINRGRLNSGEAWR